MQQYIVELSKYVIVLFLAFYTLEAFLVFHFKEKSRKAGVYFRQKLYIFLIQLLAFYTMSEKSGNQDYLFFYGFVQVLLFAILLIMGTVYEKSNQLLLNNMSLFLGISFIILSRLSLHRAVRQFAIVLVSLIICMVLPAVFNKFRFWNRLKWLYAGAGVLALSLVLVLGNITHGSKISFSIAEITFQPSEFVKLLFVFFLAAALYEKPTQKQLILITLVAAAHVIILVLSKDLGSALIFFVAYVCVVFMATESYLYLTAGILAMAAGAVCAYFLFGHVRIRVLAWQNPFAYIDNQGYQITQSLFAVGSGGFFGLGLFGGTPGDIPYVETDFIFSAVCEELGVLSGICLLLLCINSFVMMLKIGMRCREKFYRLVAFGLGVIYIFQIFLTVGGGIKFIPLTGVTLPLVSYGGSSILTTMLMFFILQAIYMRNPQEGEKRYAKRKNAAQSQKE